MNQKQIHFSLLVDDLISSAMAYNESLSSSVSLSLFDDRAKRLSELRKRLIRKLCEG